MRLSSHDTQDGRGWSDDQMAVRTVVRCIPQLDLSIDGGHWQRRKPEHQKRD